MSTRHFGWLARVKNWQNVFCELAQLRHLFSSYPSVGGLGGKGGGGFKRKSKLKVYISVRNSYSFKKDRNGSDLMINVIFLVFL